MQIARGLKGSEAADERVDFEPRLHHVFSLRYRRVARKKVRVVRLVMRSHAPHTREMQADAGEQTRDFEKLNHVPKSFLCFFFSLYYTSIFATRYFWYKFLFYPNPANFIEFEKSIGNLADATLPRLLFKKKSFKKLFNIRDHLSIVYLYLILLNV